MQPDQTPSCWHAAPPAPTLWQHSSHSLHGRQAAPHCTRLGARDVAGLVAGGARGRPQLLLLGLVCCGLGARGLRLGCRLRTRGPALTTSKNAYIFRRQTRCIAQVLTTMSTACNEARGQVELIITCRLPCCIVMHEIVPLHPAAQPGGSRHTLAAASSPCAAAWAAWSAPVAHFRRAAAAACRTQAQEAMLMFCYRQTRGLLLYIIHDMRSIVKDQPETDLMASRHGNHSSRGCMRLMRLSFRASRVAANKLSSQARDG